MADGRRGRQQLEELSPAVTSLSVSVITVTVLLSVIAHGASAEPLVRRYGAAAGPGGNGDHGLPWAGLSTHLSFPEIAAEMFLSRTTIKSQALSPYRKLGASSRSQAVTRSHELRLLKGSGPATSRAFLLAAAGHQEEMARGIAAERLALTAVLINADEHVRAGHANGGGSSRCHHDHRRSPPRG